jgi:hypothetical protein
MIRKQDAVRTVKQAKSPTVAKTATPKSTPAPATEKKARVAKEAVEASRSRAGAADEGSRDRLGAAQQESTSSRVARGLNMDGQEGGYRMMDLLDRGETRAEPIEINDKKGGSNKGMIRRPPSRGATSA